MLAHVCQQEQSSWPTSLQEDRQLLGSRDGSLSSRKLVALQFRIEKKQVLGECLKTLQDSSDKKSGQSDEQHVQAELTVSAK